ncbi:Gag-Pol polyprotein, partial [Mucuna pruriens]
MVSTHASILPPKASISYKDKIKSDAKYYVWDDPYLWKFCSDQVIHNCIPDYEIQSVAIMGHIGQLGRYWIVGFIGLPFLRMPITSLPPVSSDKELEWPLPTGMRCLNSLFFFVKSLMFGVPKALINDQGSCFYNKTMSTLLEKYGVVQKVATASHPQTKGHAKVAHPNIKDWSRLLEDALWAHRTTYRTPLGMSPYRIVFGKACHVPVEIEHRAYWTELRLEAYENSKIYKEKVKRFNDNMILRKVFKVGQKMILFNTHLKLIVGKLRSKWDGPFVITNVFPHGAVEIRNEATDKTFKVNGHQLKLFHECPAMMEGDVEDFSLWTVKFIATKTNDAKVVVDFLKSNIFCRFGVPKALINDQGSHFCNRAMSSLLHKYGVVHRVSIAYHPMTNDQAKEIKKTLQKIVNPNQKNWSRFLKDALWEHRTTYRTPLGMSPYQIVFGKACHLLVEIKHRAYWVVKQCNLAYDQACKQRKF